MDITELIQKINNLVKEEKILKQERERRGENFNIFEIMHAQTDEVNTHSAFIASLLKPKTNHGCKDAFLSLFVDILIKYLRGREKTITFDTDLNDCVVSVEKGIGDLGRMDIVIESKGKDQAIIIENKIYASDQDRQLCRYWEYAKNHYENFIILYLTLDGHSPDDKSKENMKENDDFFCISYRSFILDWIKACKEKATSVPIVRETITQYYNLIAKLTYQDMATSKTEELIELLASEENIAVLFKINNVYNDVLDKVCNTTLVNQAKEIAKELNIEYKICNGNKWYNKWAQIQFYKTEWEHFCISFEFGSDNFKNFYYGVKFRSEEDKGQKQYKEIINKKLRGSSSEWYASSKPFYNDWNNADVFTKLYNGEIKGEIISIIKQIIEDLKDIDL